MDLSGLILCITINLHVIRFQALAAKIEIPLAEIVAVSNLSNESLKSALRYGFHRTHECQDYVKAYICIQKCVDLHYDIAYSNRNCSCFCVTKKEKAQYTLLQMFTKTKWKLGAPSTTRPAWVDKYKIKTDIEKADNKSIDKKLVDKITVNDESTQVTVNCTVTNNSESCKITLNGTMNSNINGNETLNKDNELNYSKAEPSADSQIQSKNSANSSEIETPSNNSQIPSAVEAPSINGDNSTAVETPTKNSDNSSEVEASSKNSDNSSVVEIPPKNNDNSSALEIPPKTSDNFAVE